MTQTTPITPAFWDQLYKEGRMPWDAKGVPEVLKEFLKGHVPQSVLIPGCGSSYEAVTFADAGWEVSAIDFSREAVKRAKEIVGPWSACVSEGDFFKLEVAVPFDAVYERAFLCALSPKLRKDYAQRMAEIIRSKGKLVGFFYYAETPGGPPYGLSTDELHHLLSADFKLLEKKLTPPSIPVFKDKEYWEVWERK